MSFRKLLWLLAVVNVVVHGLYLLALVFVVYPKVQETYEKAGMEALLVRYAPDYLAISVGAFLVSIGLCWGLVKLSKQTVLTSWQEWLRMGMMILVAGMLYRASRLFEVVVPVILYDAALF